MIGANPMATIEALQFINGLCLITILLGAFALSAGFHSAFSSRSSFSVATAIFGVFLLVVGFAGSYGVQYGISELTKDRPTQITVGKTFTTSEHQNISSLADSQSYSMSGGGSFFLGIGSVSVNGQTTPQYVFYKNLPDGYQLGTLPATNAIIREDATRETSNIEWVYQHSVSDKTEYLDNNETVGGYDTVSLAKTYIHVPNGTVKVQYNLDSELGK